MKGTLHIVVAAGAGVGLWLGLMGCKPAPTSRPDAPAGVAASAPAETAAPVRSEPLPVPTAPAPEAAPPTVQTTLSFAVDGALQELNAAVGNRIEPGFLVARLDVTGAEETVRQGREDLAAAELALQAARTNYLKQRQRIELGTPAQPAAEAAEAALKNALEQRNRALQHLETSIRRRQAVYLYAPLPAEVLGVHAVTGQVLRAGAPVVTLGAPR